MLGRTRSIASLAEVADVFDVAVLDQWGVLHDGTRAYPGAVDAVRSLREIGKRIAILSNSGKRAALNGDRIRAMGFEVADTEVVTSGEALWTDVAEGRLRPFEHPFPIAGKSGDAERWAKGLSISFAASVREADSLLLMGLPDGAEPEAYRETLDQSLERGLPLVCANPDRSSPRAGGANALQPGTLAHEYQDRGGTVRWYGKPHEPVFRAVERLYPDTARERFLMIGDSPGHDIAGAHGAGWQSVLVRGGLHASEIASATDAAVASLCEQHGSASPTYHIALLRA